MKTIIFTVTNDLTYDRRMQRICGALAAGGFSVLLIGRQLPNSALLTIVPYNQKRLTCWFSKGKPFYLEYNLRLFIKLLLTKADIYCAVDLDTIAPCFLVATLKGKRKVYDAHEYFSEVPEVVNRPLTKKVWELVAHLFIPHADAAYTVGDGLAKLFEQRYGIPFQVVRNVPDEANLETTSYAERKYILYQGALNVGRGLESLITAMHHIDMPLKIAGEGDLSAQLRQQVKDEGLEHKIEFLGFVKPVDLPQLTSGAYIGLNLLKHLGLSYYYSLANKFFDYIQAGVPTINMDFPEYRALNDEYNVSLLLNELSPDAIIQAVNMLIEQPTMHQTLSENCLSAKKVLNWQKEQLKLLTLYREL